MGEGRQLTYYMLLFGLIFMISLTYKMEYVRHPYSERSLYIDKQDKNKTKEKHIFIGFYKVKLFSV